MARILAAVMCTVIVVIPSLSTHLTVVVIVLITVKVVTHELVSVIHEVKESGVIVIISVSSIRFCRTIFAAGVCPFMFSVATIISVTTLIIFLFVWCRCRCVAMLMFVLTVQMYTLTL